MTVRMPDHILNQFRLLASRETLSGVSTEEIVALAHQTMAEGVYHHALLAIVDIRPQTHAEIAPQLQLFCDDLHIAMGDTARALHYLLDHFIARMALQNSDPNTELVSLMDAVGAANLDRIYRSQRSLGLEHLFSLAMQYSYFVQLHDVPTEEWDSARESCTRLVSDLRKEARDWIDRHGSLRGALLLHSRICEAFR